jgi:hypothetical protein
VTSTNDLLSIEPTETLKEVGSTAPAFTPGVVSVHIWDPRGGKRSLGHASVTLGDGTHISWWPNTTEDPGVFTVCPANDPQGYGDDVDLEGNRPPDRTILLRSLDQKKIKQWWRQFSLVNHLWSTTSCNCSDVAIEALMAGEPKWYDVAHEHGDDAIRTPDDVERFANRIRATESDGRGAAYKTWSTIVGLWRGAIYH